MTRNEINETVKTIRELKRMQEELVAEIQANEDKIKAEMEATQIFTMTGDDYKVTWNEVTSTRLDTSALKKALPEICEKFSKTSIIRRFCIN